MKQRVYGRLIFQTTDYFFLMYAKSSLTASSPDVAVMYGSSWLVHTSPSLRKFGCGPRKPGARLSKHLEVLPATHSSQTIRYWPTRHSDAPSTYGSLAKISRQYSRGSGTLQQHIIGCSVIQVINYWHFKSASSSSKTDTLNIWCKILQDVAVTLDNNWDIKHIVSCCLFPKLLLLIKRVLFSTGHFPLRYWYFTQRHTWGVVESLVIALLQIFAWFWQWTKFENWSITL